MPIPVILVVTRRGNGWNFLKSKPQSITDLGASDAPELGGFTGNKYKMALVS